jgi:hypothetical protein
MSLFRRRRPTWRPGWNMSDPTPPPQALVPPPDPPPATPVPVEHTIVDVDYGDGRGPLKQCFEHGPACAATNRARRFLSQPLYHPDQQP